MPPPALRWDYHGGPHADLMLWLGTYRLATPGVRCSDNSSIRLDLDNEPQPDAAIFIEPRSGGQVKITDGYIEGAPELVAEVSSTSVSIDVNTKFNVYRRNGVREYLVWRVRDQAIDWFTLREGRYEPLAPIDGVLRSQIFPGLWLDPAALIREDLAAAIQVLQRGLASPEHAAFAARLLSASSSR